MVLFLAKKKGLKSLYFLLHYFFQTAYHDLPQKQTSAPTRAFTKRRQLREVSTPNKDVWRGAALLGTNQRRCVKTERRRRAVEDRFGWCCEGVIRGISHKIPLIRTLTSY